MAVSSNLGIPLLEGSTIVSKNAINAAFQKIDQAALSKNHERSGGHWATWAAGKTYVAGEVIRTDDCYSWGYLQCTTAGTSGAIVPACPYGEGDTVTDGTLVWTLKKIGSGSVKHGDLTGRNLADQHTIAAVTGLQTFLDTLITAPDAKGYTDQKIADLINGAPGTLDTLNEIADQLAQDETATAAIIAQLGNKVDKVDGKGLSSNDYDNAAKAKVDFITVTKTADIDNMVEKAHSHTNKETLDKFGEDNGTPTFNGTALVGGAQSWTAATKYQATSLVVVNGMLYRCKMTHTSGATFDLSNWELLDIGYIPLWEMGKTYQPGMVVTRGNNIFRCLTAHLSATWDNIQRNYWEIIAGKGASLAEWQPNTDYGTGESVLNNDCLYYALSDHHSSSTFSSDMQAGFEKWKSVGAAGGAGALKQVTSLGAVAPKQLDIVIPWTDTFLTPPVEFLKFVPGAQDQVYTACSFDNGDADDFIVDGVSGELSPWIIFDGDMKPRTSYSVNFSDVTTLNTGKESVSDFIDMSIYKLVSSIIIL